ncbi:MAG: hypothetical protein ACREMH_00580 [Gemmatimonadales bacterium]
MNDRTLATSGVPGPGTAVSSRTVAQTASFTIILSLSFCHLLNDLMQSLVPALYPILKASYGLSFGGAAALGRLADLTSISTVYRLTPFLLSLGLLTALLPRYPGRRAP